jgi:hypothetical protein
MKSEAWTPLTVFDRHLPEEDVGDHVFFVFEAITFNTTNLSV